MGPKVVRLADIRRQNRWLYGTMQSMSEVLNVSELNRYVRQLIEKSSALLKVQGEVSNLIIATSGHAYFSLKDATAQVRCVMFRNRVQLLPMTLSNGLQVTVTAQATMYEARGEFQLQVDMVAASGAGALYEQFLRLKKKLEAAGLLDAARKRPLPVYPQHVALITSATGAALQDMQNVLSRRAPHLRRTLYPASVQGSQAVQEIMAALAQAAQDADVIVIARGGGSMEDLHIFNSEDLAHAIAACPVPIITGIGHETDTTLADLVADVRAPTPSAAAELLSQGYVLASAQLIEWQHRLRQYLANHLASQWQQLDRANFQLHHHTQHLQSQKLALAVQRETLAWHIVTYLQQQQQHLAFARRQLRTPTFAALSQQLSDHRRGMHDFCHQALQRLRENLDRLCVSLTHLNPQAVLARGYSIVRHQAGTPVLSSHELAISQQVELTFHQGAATAEIVKTFSTVGDS